MKKIEITNNLNLDVYINGYPNENLIPAEVFDMLASILETNVSELIEKSEIKRRYNQVYRSKSKKTPTG